MARKEEGSGESSLKRKKYEKELRSLQAELCKLQDWIKYKGLQVIVVFFAAERWGMDMWTNCRVRQFLQSAGRILSLCVLCVVAVGARRINNLA